MQKVARTFCFCSKLSACLSTPRVACSHLLQCMAYLKGALRTTQRRPKADTIWKGPSGFCLLTRILNLTLPLPGFAGRGLSTTIITAFCASEQVPVCCQGDDKKEVVHTADDQTCTTPLSPDIRSLNQVLESSDSLTTARHCV